jgi:hypothetical protein
MKRFSPEVGGEFRLQELVDRELNCGERDLGGTEADLREAKEVYDSFTSLMMVIPKPR